MPQFMLQTLITSKTRLKLLQKFFLNPNTVSYLRNLEAEFGESTNSIRVELNRFEDGKMLKSFTEGNKKYYQANTEHPLYEHIHAMVLQEMGLENLIETAKNELEKVEALILTGDLASGRYSDLIDLIFVGPLERSTLSAWIDGAEKKINCKIRYLNFSLEEFRKRATEEPQLVLWKKRNE